MTVIQERLFQLLDEIDEICEMQGLSYYLTGQLATSAYRSESLESGTRIFEILMPYNDILRLQDTICAGAYKDREIESVYTNEEYSDFMFRYVDSSSLFLELTHRGNRKCHGLYIRIRPLYTSCNVKMNKKASKYEWFWRFYHKDYPNKCQDTAKSRITRIKRKIALSMIENKKSKYHKKMLEYRRRSQTSFNLDSNIYYEKLDYSKKFSLPDGILLKKKKYVIENRKYYMPEDIETYLGVVSGNDWQEKVFKNKNATLNTIASAVVPYKEYLDELSKDGVELSISAELEQERKCKEVMNIHEAKVANAWHIVQRSGARIALAEKYAPLKDDIVKYHQNGDWEQLRSILAEYDEYEREFERKKLVLCFDREIFDIYIELLRHDGQDNRAEKMIRDVPKQHLEKNALYQ